MGVNGWAFSSERKKGNHAVLGWVKEHGRENVCHQSPKPLSDGVRWNLLAFVGVARAACLFTCSLAYQGGVLSGVIDCVLSK